MTQRLPDFYYTKQTLDGTNPQSGPKQLGLAFNQGEEARFSTYLNMFGQPFDLAKYDLFVLVKRDDWAERVIWRATVGNGIFPVEGVAGYFEIWVPSLVTRHLNPGAYHFAFQAKEKTGANGELWDSTISLREDIVQILRSADMPHPYQSTAVEFFTKYNADECRWEYVEQAIELTTPANVPVLIGGGGGVYSGENLSSTNIQR